MNKAVFGRDAPGYIDEECNLSKGKKRDSQGQDDMSQRNMRAYHSIDVLYEEVRVFEECQQAEIDGDSEDQKRARPSGLARAERGAHTIIEDDRCQ